jgi:hypothetical protein
VGLGRSANKRVASDDLMGVDGAVDGGYRRGATPADGKDERMAGRKDREEEKVERTSISGPPTHRTAGRSFCISRWLASSSKPHWQMTRLAPVSLTLMNKGKYKISVSVSLPQTSETSSYPSSRGTK